RAAVRGRPPRRGAARLRRRPRAGERRAAAALQPRAGAGRPAPRRRGAGGLRSMPAPGRRFRRRALQRRSAVRAARQRPARAAALQRVPPAAALGIARVAAERITIALPEGSTVSGLIEGPSKPMAGYVLAHGAGAGMEHPFMSRVARGLAERGIATLRYQFPYIERGSRRPDVPKVAHAAVRAAVAEAARRWPKLPLLAGGKSFGGRMTSQAQALEALPGVVGL